MKFPTEISRLPNGLRVATAEMRHMASVSVGLWVGTGSRYEPAALNGACHFIEHMLFKGTRSRTAQEISQAVEGLGGYLNAFTSEEMTCFHARAHADYFAELVEVLSDMLLHSEFAPREFAKEREVIKEEVAMYADQPQQYVHELLNATVWPDQPLGRPITGNLKQLDRLARRDLLRWLRENYRASNTVLVAAGNVRHREVVRAAARWAKPLPAGSPRAFVPVQIRQQAPQVKLCRRNVEQTQLALGLRTCSRHDARRYALRLLNALLGENMSSRLFQVVREERGLAYSIYSALSFWDDCGDLVIAAGLDAGNLEQVTRLILRELRRFTAAPPTAAELRRAQDFAIGQLELGLESTDNVMNFVGEQLLGYGHVSAPGEIKRRLAAVRGAEIQAVARDFFRPERLNLALVSPRRSERGLARLLV